MSFDSCLTLLQLQDKLPVDVIRETAREYEAEGIKPAEALARAVTEHLDEAKRQEAHIVATIKEKFTASGGKLPEPAAAPVEPKAAKTVAPDETRDTRGTGVRFHGTSRELPGGRPNNEYAMSGDNRNIYGQGFYTTDAADISEGYMKKGKGGTPTLYEVQERGAPKLYDMEQPLTPEVRAMAERVMGDEFPEMDIDGKPVTTLREVFDEYRNESRNFGLTRDEVQEVFDSIRYNLEQEGYAGYRHIGGLKTKNAPHDVRIYWTPEDHLDVEKSDLGKYKGEAAADPASPDIRYSIDHPLAADSARAVSPLVQSLADQGAIVLHQDASTLPVKGKLPAGVQALTDKDGTIHVVANALGDNATGIILHEAFHSGGEALVGSKAWDGLTKRLGNLYSLAEKGGGTSRAFFDAARDRVETAKAKGAVSKGMEAEEFGAYAIEEYAKAPLSIRKWVDDLLGHVKAWALARFGAQLGEVTPAQLSSLAKLALLDAHAARGGELQPAYSADRRADERSKWLDRFNSVFPSKAARFESAENRLRSNAEQLGNLLVSPAFTSHGLGGLEIPAQRKVLSGVIRLADDSQVRRSIVEFIPVDVVDILARKQLSTDILLSDQAVLRDFLSADSEGSVATAVDVARSLRRAITFVATKYGSAHASMSAGGAETNAAMGAGVGDGFHGDSVSEIKGAGNSGEFGDTPDIRYSVAGAAPEPVSEEHRSALSKMIGVPKELLKSAAFNVRMAVVPMAAGSEQAMAMAKDFANHNRRAATQWTAFDKVLKNSYSDEQLKKMWVAADQENDLRREGRTSATEGLASLSAGERRTVELLHAYGEQLWAKAKDAGLVTGDGVAFWTPRVAANIVADGSAEAIRQPAGEFSKDARNLRTSAASTKQRKHETTAESEAALKAKLGEDAEYVKNIRVMPMAMAQLEKAIAGRTLVNQIKAHGKLAGDDMVSDEGRPNFVTFDHPALKQYRPKMDWQAADMDKIQERGYEVRADGVYRDSEKLASYRVQDGEVQKLAPMLDSNGKPVMESFPLFVRKDFAGPLQSVFSSGFKNDGIEKTYRALMELKGASMSMIMFSPATHNAVIWGKAMPSMITAMGWKNNLKNIGTGGIYTYVVGHQVRQDHAEMARLIEGGLVPMGGRGMNPDLPAIADGIKPGRSILAKVLGAALDPISKTAGNGVRRGVDAAGHFWHETLLWDRIGDMQAGMAAQLRAHMMDNGISEYAATRIATHFANRYAGAIPQEAISQAAHVTMNVLAFSKSFTLTNVGAMKDPIAGLPKEIQAQIKLHMYEAQKAMGKTEIEALDAAGQELKQAQSATRKKALMILMVDFAAMAALNSMLQAWLQGQNGKEFMADLKERTHALGVKLDEENPLAGLGPTWGKAGLPLALLRHPFENLEILSQTHDNPHGKQDRVRIGEDEHGNSYYLRPPTGKVVEEMKNYTNLDTATGMLKNKMSPLAGSALESIQNQDFQGRRVYKPNDNLFVQIGKSVGHMMKAQVPFDDLVALKHVVSGDNDQGGKVHFAGRDWNMDEAKLMGSMTGLSVSKVAGGDAVAEMRYQNREQQADLRDVLPDVREALRRGDQEKAEQLLEEAGQTPKEAMRIMRQIEQPGRISKQSLRKFNAHADDSERARLEKMRARAQ